ncbi:MAG: Asp-tRNA(Asn)/Glu-tRNA(Gln) amidotransferase subunit GatC [Desulfovibrionaceae bacterium]|nr:Asp-tRNA(Asn)/Glu-tRNA(Gln) amidotransferase subunit GatC [Desulfovibrionaceae bacterium]
MTPADFQHLCRLARLAPDEAKRDQIAAQCSAILTYMDTLAELDTTDVDPLYSPALCLDDAATRGEGAAPVRPDMAERRRSREDILSGAPDSDGSFFVVPRIVEGKS